MILRTLSIVQLHGALTLNISFFEDISLLVGINGSGKTSALNVIDWLLEPDLKRLAIAEFKRLALTFEEEGTEHTLTAEKDEKLLTLSIIGSKTALKPITVNLRARASADPDELRAAYSGLRPEKHELPMWNLLKSFSKATVISLDRSISAESNDVKYVETHRGPMHSRTRSRSPMAYVQEVTSAKYADFRRQAIEYDNELKAEIVMSALQDPELAFSTEAIQPMTPDQIFRLEEKVSAYLARTIKSGDVGEQVRRFFRSSRNVTAREGATTKPHNYVIDFVISQYRQIESLAKAFNNFDLKSSLAFKALDQYLQATNRFLNDSHKELYFDESTGKLAFSFKLAESRTARPISRLSSGERQILILFTFLAFASKPRSVFIIDEPELSLHPKWQAEFLDVFLSLRPAATQLLLATHSPDIVGKYKRHCVVLTGDNL